MAPATAVRCVMTVGRDETVVREYIRQQEKDDQRLFFIFLTVVQVAVGG